MSIFDSFVAINGKFGFIWYGGFRQRVKKRLSDPINILPVTFLEFFHQFLYFYLQEYDFNYVDKFIVIYFCYKCVFFWEGGGVWHILTNEIHIGELRFDDSYFMIF